MRNLFILVLLALTLTSCEATSEISSSKDPHVLYTDERGDSYSYDSLPFDMKLNQHKLSCISFDFYQKYSNYEYYGYAIVGIDINKIPENELHWMDKDQLLKVNLYLTSENNHIDFDTMLRVGYFENDNIRYYLFYTDEPVKREYINGEITLSVDVKQEDTYDYEGENGVTALNVTNGYMYNKTLYSVLDYSSMESYFINAFKKGIEDINKYLLY